MKKLTFLSLLSCAILARATTGTQAENPSRTVKAIRATKKVYRTAKSYVQETATDVSTEVKDIATEIKEQMAEIGQEVYENNIKVPAITIKEKAAAFASAFKEKMVAAKKLAASTVDNIKNSEFADDMADIGAQLKEGAVDACNFVTEKSTNIWNGTKETVQTIREELAN